MFITPTVIRFPSRERMLALGLAVWAGTALLSPASAQTDAPAPASGASTPEAEAAMKRAQRQSENVYRWIKIHADTKRKPDPVKPKPKVEPIAVEAARSEPRPAVVASPARAPETAAPKATVEVTGTAAPTQEAPSTTAALPTPPEQTAAANTRQEEEVDAELKPISTPPPEFPRELRSTVSTGKVTVAFTVQTDGTVADALAENSTNRRLSKAALDAVSKWRFEPLPSAETYKVEINFQQ